MPHVIAAWLLSLLALTAASPALAGEIGREQTPRVYFGYSSRYEQSLNGKGREQVLAVTPGSPAALAGLLPGDIIVGARGRASTFSSLSALVESFADVKAGEAVRFSLLRAGRPVELEILPTAATETQFRALADTLARCRRSGGCNELCNGEQPEAVQRINLLQRVQDLGRQQMLVRWLASEDRWLLVSAEPPLPSTFSLADVAIFSKQSDFRNQLLKMAQKWDMVKIEFVREEDQSVSITTGPAGGGP